MALSRRSGQRFQASIWPGFVDAMTALLLVLIFVLTIFMVVQSIQNETITGQENELDRQENELDRLAGELDSLARALGTEQQKNFELEDELQKLGIELDEALTSEAFQSRLIETLTVEIERRNQAITTAEAEISAFEAQVASLLADRDAALGQIDELQGSVDDLGNEKDALQAALALARDEIDAGVEEARLAAARREALESLIADLRSDADEQSALLSETQAQLDETASALSEEEAARLAEAAAAEALRARLEDADAELTAMTLSLERQRQEAENTLALLAAANAARADLDEALIAAVLASEAVEATLAETRQTLAETEENLAESEGARQNVAEELSASEAARAEILARLSESTLSEEELRAQLAAILVARNAAEAAATSALSDAERQAQLLAVAQAALDDQKAISTEDQRKLALVNEQLATLRSELGELQALLDLASEADVQAEVRIETLSTQLNQALARAAAEQRKRAELEAAERARLEAEAEQLSNYRSEFFGRLREVLGNQDGVEVVGDRFVFSSEVLFASGSADLSLAGRLEISKLAELLEEVAAVIPANIDWVIRVDGHTDNIPISGGGEFDDNWELSQARALSVVRYMVDVFGFPPERLAAAGFAEFQPLDPADTVEARARNRRIELKLTER